MLIYEADDYVMANEMFFFFGPQSMDGGRQSRSRDAETNVHSSGQSVNGGTMDAKSGFIS